MKSYKLAAIAVVALYLHSSCAKSPEQDGLGHHHENPGHIDSHDPDHDHEASEGGAHKHHDGEITLSEETARDMGVSVATVSPSEFHEVLKVSGQIVPSPDGQQTVSARSAGIVTLSRGATEGSRVRAGQTIATISSKGIAGGDPNAASQAAVNAAKRELDRITPLHKEGIVSTRDFNAAKAAYEQARAAYGGSPSGSGATSSIDGVITRLLVRQGEYVNAGQPIAEISGNRRLTLRADVPARNRSFLSTITSANFRAASNDSTISLTEVNGGLLSDGITAASSGGYAPVYFTMSNNGSIAPGTFTEVYLIGASRQDVITVPVGAVTEQQGNHYVYVRGDHECYDKRLVKLGGNDGRRVEIVSGIKAGDKVVVTGATVVKLAESSGAVPEGHSHNH